MHKLFVAGGVSFVGQPKCIDRQWPMVGSAGGNVGR